VKLKNDLTACHENVAAKNEEVQQLEATCNQLQVSRITSNDALLRNLELFIFLSLVRFLSIHKKRDVFVLVLAGGVGPGRSGPQ